MLLQRLCIIGVGLIGGSLAQALRQAGQCGEIVGCGRGLDNLRRAVQLGVIDRFAQEPARAAAGADMIVLAVPVRANRGVLQALAPSLQADAVITDAGSVKAAVIGDARAALAGHLERFIPGHPVAGTERSGVEAAFPALFRNRRVILTPLAENVAWAKQRVAAMWQATGATVHEMDAEAHDRILGATSHLPHVLAYTLVDCLNRMDASRDIFRYAAGGFADFTRIASSSPEMWHDIVLSNREALLASLGEFQADLQSLVQLLETRDSAAILELFTRAKAARDRFTAESADPAS